MKMRTRTTTALGVLLALGLITTSGPVLADERDHRAGEKKDKDKKDKKDKKKGGATLDVNLDVNVQVGGSGNGQGKGPPPPLAIVKATGFTPRAGIVGTQVTIQGSGFDQRTRVFVGGRPLPQLISIAPTQITFAFPPRHGDGTIEVRHPSQAALNLGRFVVDVAPKLTKLRPLFGPIGTRVELEGEGFQATDQLLLGASAVAVLERAGDRLVAQVPAGATTGKFSIVRGGAPVAVARQTFTVVLPSPTVTSFAPTTGPPGTVVKVLGANFAADDKVYLGGAVMPIQARGQGFVDVVVPLTARASAPITVRSPRGAGVSAQPFVLVLPPTITRFAPTVGGAGVQVQLLGRMFLPTDEVRLGDKPAKIINRTEVVLTVEVPAAAPSAPWNIVRGGVVVASSRLPFGVTVAPTITAFAPEAGPPGSKVTITGTGFSADSQVSFGAQQLRVSARGGEQQLFVTLPPNATSQPFTVTNRGGTVQSAKPFAIQTISTIDGVSPLFGPVGSRVTIAGRNQDASDKYYLGTVLLPVVERTAGAAVVQIPAGAVSGPIVWESWGNKATSRFKFDVRQPIAYASHSPVVAPPGYPIAIAGAAFTPTTQVFWGSMQLKVTSRSPVQLIVRGPSGPPGVQTLTLRDGGAEAKSTSPFELITMPVIKGFTPASASVGSQVTMTGSGFDAGLKVKHNGVELPYVSVSPTQAYMTVPATASGSHPLVMDLKGGFQVISATKLTIANVALPPPPPVPPVPPVPPAPPTPAPPAPPAPVDPNHAAHEHPHQHPHPAGDHHHHPHGHPHKPGQTHHHPY